MFGLYCYNLSIGIALNVWFIMNGMCVKNNTQIYVAWTSNNRVIAACELLLLHASTLWCFAHLPLALSDHNKMVLWPGCEGCARCSLHKKKVRSVWFIIKRRGCCCNLSIGVALNVRFTMNGMCTKNNTQIHVVWTNNNRVIVVYELYCCSAATVWSFVHLLFGLSDCNCINFLFCDWLRSTSEYMYEPNKLNWLYF